MRLHLFWLTTHPEDDATPATGLLTADEKARVLRWGALPRAREFLLGRWLLHYAASSWELGAGWLDFSSTGRPLVKGQPGVDVSLAHSGDQIVVALCAGGRVGVDVETHANRERTMLDRFFHPDELEWMGKDPARLHRIWTVKEAALKALGVGVSGNPQRVHFHPDTDALTIADVPPDQPVWCSSFSRDAWSAATVVLPDEGKSAPTMVMERVSLSNLRAWLFSTSEPPRKTA